MNSQACRAALAVAGLYGCFLIFAQFAFVELLRVAGVGLLGERWALGLMALGGMVGGFWVAARGVTPSKVKTAMGLAAVAATMATGVGTLPALLFVATATGAALGVATVGMAAMLPAWCGVVWVGVGTGIGYACCNLPWVFLQSPATQAWFGAGLSLTGMIALPSQAGWQTEPQPRVFPMWGAVAIFTALVGLDSAAFFIIQHTANFKSGTWAASLLWRNAALHLALAVIAGGWLARGGARALPVIAWAVLAVAALAVSTESSRGLAGWLYPSGVSLYATALVAWPGWYAGARDMHSAAWRAAWLFAIAGWIGSANGIGMTQSLHHIPPGFIVAAGGVILVAMIAADRRLWRPTVAVAVVIAIATLIPNNSATATFTAGAHGRQVYVAEGCIHCHSQYSRPGSADEAIWGPAPDAAETLHTQPVLIGNRRQGPDLTNIGARRSEAWLKAHFLKPQTLAPGSCMPDYNYLFHDSRGQDLVRYLKESGVATTANLMAQAALWQPDRLDQNVNSAALFAANCLACHGTEGRGNGPLAKNFARPPANLVDGPFIWSPAGDALELRVARIIKFGLPGPDMPGHETLTDSQVMALTRHVLDMRQNGRH